MKCPECTRIAIIIWFQVVSLSLPSQTKDLVSQEMDMDHGSPAPAAVVCHFTYAQNEGVSSALQVALKNSLETTSFHFIPIFPPQPTPSWWFRGKRESRLITVDFVYLFVSHSLCLSIMAFAVVYFAPANTNLFSPPMPTPTSRQPTFFRSTSDFSATASSSSSSSSLSSHKPVRNDKTICASKRDLNLSLVAAVIFSAPFPASSIATMYENLELERYTDSKEGFTFLRPSSWIKVDKAGANVLFEEASKGANNVGVVVTPVRLTSLREFGSSQFVAEKLVQAEKRKESTKDAEVIAVTERSGQGGLQVYEFEYKVDSTRGGMKRIFSAAFVASRKLYLLNIAYTDKPESPLDTNKRMILEKVLHSFDAVRLA